MIRGSTYWLRGNLYLAVTNKVNSTTFLSLRGPGFVMPSKSCFQALENDQEPTSDMLHDCVEDAFEKGKIRVDSMDSEPITFAGLGEPLLRKDCIYETANKIKEHRHGVPLRVKTNGLIGSKDCASVASMLKSSGIDKMSISLVSDNPKQYQDIMQPMNGLKFQDVCSFVIACVEADMEVECTAVDRPDVNVSAVRALSLSLGAQHFSVATFFPSV